MADDPKPPAKQDLAPLIRYQGTRPEAPDWFGKAVQTPAKTLWVEVEGARIHARIWGDSDKPGVLLVHGNGAHAHWYDFIAPQLSDRYHIVAMTFGGMGDSGWRQRYSVDMFSAEQLAVCKASGLFDQARKPVIVAHSFGGFIAMNTASQAGERFSGVMIVDSPVRPPEDDWEGPPSREGPNRVYADLTAALARFRLAPPQPCDNHFIVDYIARHSLKQVQVDDKTGWTWKFDPSIWTRFDAMEKPADMFRAISCRLSVMRGADSVLLTDRVWSYMRGLRDDQEMLSIPGAQHHVMLDQPEAFIAAVEAQLQRWAY